MLFPQTVCQKIDKLTRHFIWNGKSGARSLNLVNWNTLISPRHFGGLSVKDARSTNLLLLGKLIWELMQNSAKCWIRLVLHKYMQNGSVVQFTTRKGASYTWQSLVKAFGELKDGFIWYDSWLESGSLCNRILYVHISDINLKVQDVWSGGNWDFSQLHTSLTEEIKWEILSFNPIANALGGVGWHWKEATSRIYTAVDGYMWLIKRKCNWIDTNS